MSVRDTRSPGPVFVTGSPEDEEDVPVFVSASVDHGVPMTLYQRPPDDSLIAILLGKERITLEFYDIESLERLRDLADEGVRRLREVPHVAEVAR